MVSKYYKHYQRPIFIGIVFVLALVVGFGTAIKTYAASLPLAGKILFTSNKSGSYEVYTMNRDGSDEQQLTHVASASATDPTWSRDGTKITFSVGASGAANLFVMNADGSNIRQLTTSGLNDVAASWSPDDQQITFTSSRDGRQQVYVMNADGSNQHNITNDTGSDGFSDWSSDGSKIVYRSLPTGGHQTIFTINPDGSGKQQISDGLTNATSPRWSPDGTKIAYHGQLTGGLQQILTMNANGSNIKQLTSSSTNRSVNPSWSPDGTVLLFNTTGTTSNEIYTMSSSDGSGLVQLTSDTNADDQFASYQPLTIAPTLGVDAATVDAGKATNVQVLADDSSVYSAMDPASVILTSQPGKGTATVNSDGSITYLARAGTPGSDSFTYQACAQINPQLCGTAQVSVTIAPGVPDTGWAGRRGSRLPLVGAATVLVGVGLAVLGKRQGHKVSSSDQR